MPIRSLTNFMSFLAAKIKEIDQRPEDFSRHMPRILEEMKKMQTKKCPHGNSILVYADEFVKSKKNEEFKFSKIAQQVQRHLAETECVVCRLIFQYYLAMNKIGGNISNDIMNKTLFIEEAKRVVQILGYLIIFAVHKELKKLKNFK